MPRNRPSHSPTAITTPARIPLAHPNRSPDPSKDTLIDWAHSRHLLPDEPAASDANAWSAGHDALDDGAAPRVARLAESVLWSCSLAVAHFTLDFLVQHQYAQEMAVRSLVLRSLQAFPVILFFFYLFHPHPSGAGVLHDLFPLVQGREEDVGHMVLFFVGSVASGCYLIHVTNMYPYYAVMKQAAPVGCVWIWSVVELSLIPAVVSLLCCVAFLFWGGYAFL